MTRGNFLDVSERGIVSLEGSESLDLLQRISTNDVATLNSGGAVATVLTNEKGRIVEVVTILDRGKKGLLVAGQSEDPQIMKEWIEKYVIMEDIKVNVVSDDFIHLLVYDTTMKIQDALPSVIPPDCRVFEEMLTAVRLIHVLASKALGDATINGLSEAGFMRVGRHDFDEYRVLNGIPRSPHELSTAYNPLEAGLLRFVSFTKGCYIGQEVVARLDTYRKVQRQLVRLKMEVLPAQLPETIYFEGKEWGTVTSALRLSGSRECRGLGYIKAGSDASSVGFYFPKGSEKIRIAVDLLGFQSA
jgi:folate-binding protein YgfZ